jgi:hypothetical protein
MTARMNLDFKYVDTASPILGTQAENPEIASPVCWQGFYWDRIRD